MGSDEMNIQDDIAPGTQAIFEFKGKFLVLIWLCAVICITGFLGISLIMSGGSSGRVIFLLISCLFLFAVSGLLLHGRSDVVIDENGISRRLFDKTWQTIRWENVRLITAFPVSGGSGYKARAFNIFPVIKPRIRLFPSGKMFFDDKLENAPRLVELLNYYVIKYGIKTETRDSLLGKLTPSTHL